MFFLVRLTTPIGARLPRRHDLKSSNKRRSSASERSLPSGYLKNTRASKLVVDFHLDNQENALLT